MCLIGRGMREAKKEHAWVFGNLLQLLKPFKIIQHALPAPISKVEAYIYIVYNIIKRLLVTRTYPWRLSGAVLTT